MAKLVVEIVPVLTDNYVYLLHEPISGATAAVDPAVADPVLERLAARGWSLSHVLITHHHGDHIGGVPDLVRQTGCAVVGAGRDAARLPPLTIEVSEGDTFLLGSTAAVVLAVPGHTTGHLAFWFPDSHALFCGDALFSLGCGRLFEGTAAEMWASLCKLRDLPPDTQVYCGHEYTAANGRFARLVERDNPALLIRLKEVEGQRAKGRPTLPSTIASERAANPFMRADEPTVARAVGMEPGTAPAQVLAELRRRKDVF
ncbi:hydroxyacylglutathione hydrolase [Magnetospirillum molischianum]|uniref:Hydroxyacylglutathione hydrolase n=1 Tax=Magnetospirillum molischianum DSM 120 TaxID=1150626 RepID=H8FXA6_MAGML|nr:hydroxyacylglutathione hydrolase [Magnetospirillum molischianum]CCG42994.1 putative hydroxyacylglutathione hydrolase (Glyoxalase II) [Magnetospirillum molischianum DSM 120]